MKKKVMDAVINLENNITSSNEANTSMVLSKQDY